MVIGISKLPLCSKLSVSPSHYVRLFCILVLDNWNFRLFDLFEWLLLGIQQQDPLGFANAMQKEKVTGQPYVVESEPVITFYFNPVNWIRPELIRTDRYSLCGWNMRICCCRMKKDYDGEMGGPLQRK